MKLLGIIFGCLMIGVAMYCVCKFCSYTYRNNIKSDWDNLHINFDDEDLE